jgi:hypothetical protein
MARGKNSDPLGGDPTLRRRVTEQMPIVTDALDAAIASPTDHNLEKLHEETDKLMRALGRVLIEIERLRNMPEH